MSYVKADTEFRNRNKAYILAFKGFTVLFGQEDTYIKKVSCIPQRSICKGDRTVLSILNIESFKKYIINFPIVQHSVMPLGTKFYKCFFEL